MTDNLVFADLDATDRALINGLQGGFPVCERPFAEIGGWFGLSECEVISRISRLCHDGTASRFGPLYNTEAMGGGVTLAAMWVPEDNFDDVARLVNSYPEVAHNYERTHVLNMWFVVLTENPGRVAEVLQEIEKNTGLRVYDMPKEEEFFLELKLEALAEEVT
ncbi:AsnC family transcriptional regulator [Kiloniella laminariae]|uniref:siroheme decarboxylase n=1 Tax=Kiloniella laminariae TaxID=454162 RepID=A0ABT4LGS5_9PROT|nr:AsnC family transcriptional regulator [Kiloniella laminariae]MCZ4280311.1 AsnC family transcriptional regulator [Kiloniella laminariae]